MFLCPILLRGPMDFGQSNMKTHDEIARHVLVSSDIIALITCWCINIWRSFFVHPVMNWWDHVARVGQLERVGVRTSKHALRSVGRSQRHAHEVRCLVKWTVSVNDVYMALQSTVSPLWQVVRIWSTLNLKAVKWTCEEPEFILSFFCRLLSANIGNLEPLRLYARMCGWK